MAAFKREKVVRNAEKYVAKGKIEAAIKEYMKVLAENPKDAGTLNRVGDLYTRISRNDEAIKLFLQIANQYTEDGFLVKAIAIYKKIIKLDPGRLAVYERLGDLYHDQGLANDARGQYQILADYYLKNDDGAAAINVYQKMVEIEPSNPSHHLKLAELFQQGQLWDKALASYGTIAGLMIEHGRIEEAGRVYLRAVEVHSKDVGFITDAVLSLRDHGDEASALRLAELAAELNPKAEKIAALIGEPPAAVEEPDESEEIQEAEAYVATESSDALEVIDLEDISVVGDDEVLEAADEGAAFEIDLDDEIADSQVLPPMDMGARGTAFGEGEVEIEDVAFEAAEASREMPAMEDEVEIDLDLEGEFELELELEAPEGIDWDIPPADEPVAPPVQPVAAPEPEPAPPLRPEDALAEAEVFAKYGLAAKANERLNTILETHPDLLGAHGLRLELQIDAGEDPGSLIEVATHFRELARQQQAVEAWDRMRGRLEEVGIVLDGEELEVLPVEPEPQKDRVSKLLEALEPDSGGFEPIEPEAFEEGLPSEIELDADIETLEIETAPDGEAEAPVAEPVGDVPEAVEAPPEPAPEPEPEAPRPARKKKIDIEDELAALASGVLGSTAKTRRAAPPPPPEVREEPIEERVDEPVVDEAPALPPAEPVEPSIAAAEAAPSSAPAQEPPAAAAAPPGSDLGWDVGPAPTLEEAELDDELSGIVLPEERQAASPLDDSAMDWLDDAESAVEAEAVEGDLFEGEEDFFDLAAELEEELDQEDARLVEDFVGQQEEPSLEEIVEGFKRGVAENLSEEDFATHYNLGIAYREMGLLDEAIGEFQLAAKDPHHLVDCCSMLGVCFTEKGLPELAVKWYKRGLAAPDLEHETMLSLMYDIGNGYLNLGDAAAARTTFVELYGINTNYRDVADKLDELPG